LVDAWFVKMPPPQVTFQSSSKKVGNHNFSTKLFTQPRNINNDAIESSTQGNDLKTSEGSQSSKDLNDSSGGDTYSQNKTTESTLAARLPSRNVTFSSAEILSIDEVQRYATQTSMQNMSIRVAGIMSSFNTSRSFITLEDPNRKPTRANPYRPKKRKIIHHIRSLQLKKAASGVAPPTGVIVNVSAVTPLQGCKVGDLVTVIGEMKLLADDGWSPHATNEIPNDTMKRSGYLQARIVKNSNGTDLNLLLQAVKLRRDYLRGRGWKGKGCGPPLIDEEDEKTNPLRSSCVHKHGERPPLKSP